MTDIVRKKYIPVTIFAVLLAFCSLSSAICQSVTPQTLELNKPIEKALKGGETHTYAIELKAGQFLDLVVEQKGIDVVVSLFDPTGKKLAEVDSPNGTQGPEPLSIIVEITGNYRLEVRSMEKAAVAGRYEVKIEELRAATEKDKNRIAAEQALAEATLLRAEGTGESPRNAIKKYEASLPLFRAIGDRIREAQILNSIGIVYSNLGEKQQALKFYNESLPLSRAVGDKSGEAATLNNIGLDYSHLGEKQQALKFYNESLPLSRAVGDKSAEAATLNNIGGVYDDLGEKQLALKFHNEALPLRRAIGDKSGEALTLNNIGLVYDNLGEKQQALKFYNESLPLRRAVGDKSGEAVTLNNIGLVYSALGEQQQALKFYNESLPLSRAVGNKRAEAVTLNNLFSSFAPDNPRFGVFYGKQSVNSLQILRSNVQGLDKNIQQTFLKSIGGHYRRLADALFKQKRFAETQQVLNLFKDQQFFDFKSKQETAPLALTERESALAGGFNNKLETVVTAVRKVDEFKRGVGTRQPTAAETDQVKALEKILGSANTDYLAFLKKAEAEFAPPPDEKDKEPEVADVSELQNALKETSATTKQNTVAVYTLVGEDNYSALVVTQNDVFSVSAPVKAADLNKKALQLWSLLRSPKYDPQPAANELYKLVFGPLESKLPKDTKTILWSLDGSLRYIPMGALYDGEKYLVERYNNVVFTRADKERLTRERSKNVSGVGMGSSEAHTVDLAGAKFEASALPAVQTEMKNIFRSAVWPGVLSGDVLLDRQFTRAAMLTTLKNQRPLVHIASHFKFEPGDEARSFLLLGDGTPFTLDQMKNEKDLFKGVDLLTLSACQTAAQRPDANGREVDGFAELAQRLGAGAVMASLWEVSDESTAELMSRFYRGYVNGGLNKADAIRQAQLALLKGEYKTAPTVQRQLTQNDKDAASIKIDPAKLIPFKPKKNAPYAHPYYWSPFVLIGNWK